jgi:hypothetical protein
VGKKAQFGVKPSYERRKRKKKIKIKLLFVGMAEKKKEKRWGTCLLFQLLLPRATASDFVRNICQKTAIML